MIKNPLVCDEFRRRSSDKAADQVVVLIAVSAALGGGYPLGVVPPAVEQQELRQVVHGEDVRGPGLQEQLPHPQRIQSLQVESTVVDVPPAAYVVGVIEPGRGVVGEDLEGGLGTHARENHRIDTKASAQQGPQSEPDLQRQPALDAELREESIRPGGGGWGEVGGVDVLGFGGEGRGEDAVVGADVGAGGGLGQHQVEDRPQPRRQLVARGDVSSRQGSGRGEEEDGPSKGHGSR